MKKIVVYAYLARAIGLFCLSFSVLAQSVAPLPAPEEVVAVQPPLQLRGGSTLTFLGMGIYDTRLWSPSSFALGQYDQYPFALELQYRRSLSGNLIAKRSLQEMQRQSSFDSTQADNWLARLQALFPDVKAGDRITGFNQPGVGARFAVNGKPVGEVRDALFAKLFFGIWLSPQTSESAMRCALAQCS